MKTVWMNEAQVQKLYSDKVAEMFAQGYRVMPVTMSGSQGEIAHIDFTNDVDKVYRVLLYSDTIKTEDNTWWGKEALVIEVREYDAEYFGKGFSVNKLDTSHSGKTIWNGEGTELYKQVYYRMAHGNNRYGYSYTTDDEAVKTEIRRDKEKCEARYNNRIKKSAIPVTKQLLKFVKEHGGRGYGNTRLEMIDYVEKIKGGYRIHFTRESNKNAIGFVAR